MRKKILIFGHYGVPNWGDEAILSGILSKINFTKYSITVVSDNPEFLIKTHKKVCKISSVFPPPFGLRSFFRGFFSLQHGIFDTIKAIQDADLIIFGGGGLFQDKPQKAIKIWNFYLKICKWYRKKIFLVGNSFEEMHNTKNYTFTKSLFKNVSFFSVRDDRSAEILHKKFSVPFVKIAKTSDAAYFLERKNKKKRRKWILLAFREGEIPKNKERKILKIIKKNFSNEFEKKEIRVLVMQEKKSHDKNFAIRHNLLYFEPQTVEELQGIIRTSKFIISSRLHGGILANISGTPFLVLSTRDKISQFFGEKFSFSLQKISTKKGEKQFIETLKNYKMLKAPQENFYNKQKEKLKNFFPDFLV